MTASQPPQHTSPADPMVSTTPEVPAPAAAQLKPTERPHPLTPLVRGWLILVAIAIGWGRDQLLVQNESAALIVPAISPRVLIVIVFGPLLFGL